MDLPNWNNCKHQTLFNVTTNLSNVGTQYVILLVYDVKRKVGQVNENY